MSAYNSRTYRSEMPSSTQDRRSRSASRPRDQETRGLPERSKSQPRRLVRARRSDALIDDMDPVFTDSRRRANSQGARDTASDRSRQPRSQPSREVKPTPPLPPLRLPSPPPPPSSFAQAHSMSRARSSSYTNSISSRIGPSSSSEESSPSSIFSIGSPNKGDLSRHNYTSSQTSFEEEPIPPKQRTRPVARRLPKNDYNDYPETERRKVRPDLDWVPQQRRPLGAGNIHQDDNAENNEENGGQSVMSTAASYGHVVWSKVTSAATAVGTGVSDAFSRGIARYRGEEPPGSEKQLTQAMKTYHAEKAERPKDLPDWLFNEKERRSANRSSRDQSDRQRRRYSRSQDPFPGRSRGLRDVYDSAANDSTYSSGRRGWRGSSTYRSAVDGPTIASDRLKAMRDEKREAHLSQRRYDDDDDGDDDDDNRSYSLRSTGGGAKRNLYRSGSSTNSLKRYSEQYGIGRRPVPGRVGLPPRPGGGTSRVTGRRI